MCNRLIAGPGVHNPACKPITERVEQRNALRQELKWKATDSISVRPLKVARHALSTGKFSEICAKDLSLVRRSMYRERHKHVPTIPRDKEQVDAFLREAVQFGLQPGSCFYI